MPHSVRPFFFATSNMASPSETLPLEAESEEVVASGPLKRKRGAGHGLQGQGTAACPRGKGRNSSLTSHLRFEFPTRTRSTCSVPVVGNLFLINRKRLCSRTLTARGTSKHARCGSFASKNTQNNLRKPQPKMCHNIRRLRFMLQFHGDIEGRLL